MDQLLRPARLLRPIDLAHCAPFRIGATEVRPSTRELVFGARREIVEPRVMQVLVALAEAEGETLSRSDLNELCWDGRTVGDDAMNRVISRLRILARQTGAFEIETITKVGYRLVASGAAQPPPVFPGPEAPEGPPGRKRVSRRAALLGGGLALAACAGVAGWRLAEADRHDPEADALVDHAWQAFRRDREDEMVTAISNLRLAIERDPRNARAWGLLALVYSWTTQYAPTLTRVTAEQTQDAIDRALELDPRSEFALAAQVWRTPIFGHWLQADREVRTALRRRPRSALLLNRLTDILLQTGRLKAALPVSASLQAQDLFSPTCWRLRILTLADNGRAEEAAQAVGQALRLYPRHPLVWFTVLNVLIDTAQYEAAQAFLSDRANRPLGEDAATWEVNAAVIRALATRDPGDIDGAAASIGKALSRRAYPFARAIAFQASVGRTDAAFGVAHRYFFDVRVPPALRNTHFLFQRPTAALRADPRFEALTARLGLQAYWRSTGAAPPSG